MKKLLLLSAIAISTILLNWCTLKKENITTEKPTITIQGPKEINTDTNKKTTEGTTGLMGTTGTIKTTETIKDKENLTWNIKTSTWNTETTKTTETIKDEENLTKDDIELIDNIINQIIENVDWEETEVIDGTEY